MSTKDTVQTIKDNLVTQFEGSGATLTLPAAAFAATLPEGLTRETVSQVHKHDQNFTAAFTGAAGVRAAQEFKADPALAAVVASTKVDHLKTTVTIQRQATVSAGMAKEGQPAPTREAIGATSVSVRSSLGSTTKEQRLLNEEFIARELGK